MVQIHGNVADSTSGQLLQATVEVLLSGAEDKLAITDTNLDGNYGLVLNKGSIYEMRVKLEGYSTFQQTIDLRHDPPKELEFRILMKKKD